jgi:hypothetical protein
MVLQQDLVVVYQAPPRSIPWWVWMLGVGGVAMTAGVGLTMIGFTTNGFAANFITAGIQSIIGNVVAGSTFALL